MNNELTRWLLGPPELAAHGFCLFWEPGLIWLHAVSDTAIGLAYFTIPLAIATFVRRRRDLVFTPLLVLFAAFILLCGAGHFLSLLTLWIPAYGLEGIVKAVTAAVSILTAAALWMLLPKALLLPSVRQMQEVTAALAEREHQALKLCRLNADLLQFAYAVSHDLKAPLHAITQLADWISDDIRAPPALKRSAIFDSCSSALPVCQCSSPACSATPASGTPKRRSKPLTSTSWSATSWPRSPRPLDFSCS